MALHASTMSCTRDQSWPVIYIPLSTIEKKYEDDQLVDDGVFTHNVFELLSLFHPGLGQAQKGNSMWPMS